MGTGEIPVNILTGFLGSGKTTLLNNILTEHHGEKVAVIVNEYGDINIDGLLVLHSDEDIIQMNNGCICCTVRGDLIKMLMNLLVAQHKGDITFDRIVIETTGLADPGPVAQTFIFDEALSSVFALDTIITVVDSQHIIEQLDSFEEPQEQIGFADIIMLNKIDLVDSSRLTAIRQRIHQINPTARLLESQHSQVALSDILDIYSFDLESKLMFDPDFLEVHHPHHHSDSVTSLSFIEKHPLDMEKLNHWMADLITHKGQDLLRYKGILNVEGMNERLIFQGVHMLFSGTFDRPWQPNEAKESRLIFIGKHLDQHALTKQFNQCLATRPLPLKG
ncbi:cobalamin biosynthesis protein CobW [Pullulanibacillus camelliae]|uniref:Cobalamin biosynthesis protein CobW n=1 Tax=Pullulanibacillus camelliae TaxID=1707096 RepID=A0A8J2YBE0_9BACL|nr:GTP-binding protein [Pullulanibacillus camelliae]GGE32796.1 cobalamin biosynthesis protein CobW [Pullulanibacillus camelliae]